MCFGKIYFDTLYQKYDPDYKYTQWKTLQLINLTNLCFFNFLQKNVEVMYVNLFNLFDWERGFACTSWLLKHSEKLLPLLKNESIATVAQRKAIIWHIFLSMNKYLCFCKLLTKTSWLHPQIISVKAYF